ncbi:MAG: PH domain-containing protein [Candidatus Doudnabacteria bacterium]|nr:PH domain-containing protein [Candidatus Doudnabacteria bacterium]
MPFRKIKFFSDLHTQEEVYLVVRKHWIIPCLKVVFWLILLALLAAGEIFLKTNYPFFTEPNPARIVALIRTAVLMTAVLGLFMTWIMYYLNVQIITNERIVDINQKSMLHHQTSELNLDRLQDVLTQVKGPLANFFNFGDVTVQTAGEAQNFVFNQAANPHQVAKIILELYEKIRVRQGAAPTARND